MNLYLISQNVNNGFGTFTSAIVCAGNEDEARMIHPNSFYRKEYENWDGKDEYFFPLWCATEDVEIRIIGAAARNVERGVVLASFNAG